MNIFLDNIVLNNIANPSADNKLPDTVKPFVITSGIAFTKLLTKSVPKYTAKKTGIKYTKQLKIKDHHK